ncbi:hypothetical protein CCH79_00004627, partial [Gambusia affinis]
MDNMNRIWTLVLSFAASGLTQDSPNTTLFLISAPEVLNAGSPTTIAITVFADFHGNLTAEVAQGSTKVMQKQQFQGGVTTILSLPPFPGSLSQNSLLSLTVRGYSENRLLFTNTTSLTCNLWTVSLFIQTDRSTYKPGDTINVRVVTFQLDNKPYKGRVDISLLDPSGKPVESRNSTGNLGIALKEFTLSLMSRPGQWMITATANGVTKEKSFIVEHQDEEASPFVVMVQTSSEVLFGDDISGSVRVLYSHGQPAHGTLDVTLKPLINNRNSSSLQTKTKQIYGSAQFLFSRDQLQALYSLSTSNSHVLHIAAQFKSDSTGFTVNKTVEVHVLRNKFQLMFLNFPSTLKPSLNFSTNLRIVRYDRKSLSSLDLKHSVVVQVTQRSSLINSTSMSLTLPVPENGNVLIQFKLQDQVEMLFIQARFQISEETLKVYTNYSSPTGSYIQIGPINTLPAEIGLPLQLNVESTIKPERLHFVISSKGQVVAAGTKNFSSSVTLTPELSWYPKACVTVYYIHSDGEITSDTAYISIHQYNHVTLNWSSERAQPGEEVSLTVAGSESRFQVGITVTPMQNDALQSDLDYRVGQKYNLKMMTNARFYLKNQEDGSGNEEDKFDRSILERYWNNWMETAESLLLLDISVSDKNWTSGKITVPNGVTCLGAVAVSVSEDLGLGFTPLPQMLTIFKDFSLSLVVPSHLIKGEEVILEVNVINHLDQETEVIVLVYQGDGFEFVLMDRRGASTITAQKITLGSHESASALFPIRPLALGEMEISVDAVSAAASDGLIKKIWVKPEGVEQTFSHTLFLEMTPEKQDPSESVNFSFPPNLVPGSQRAHVALVGDILALSIENLDSLVQLPTGCGEQNMVHFAPSIFVLQYLEKSGQDDEGIRNKALRSLMQGYEKQLSYQRDDGSFSAFGQSDTSALVLRYFLQAQPYMQIDQTVLTKATAWLLKHQDSQGEFTEVGTLIHTEMRGGQNDSPVALTAYVLLAFLEDDTYSEMYADHVSLSLRYLERKVSSGIVSNYTLCLVAYALALGKSSVLERVITELTTRADYRDDVMMWTISGGLRSNSQQQHSTEIEMASYVLLVLFLRGSFLESIPLMKWLSTQRSYLGGFGTTQDTIVALQILSYYAAFSGANAINLTVDISSSLPSTESLFHINSTNYRVYQSREINADKDLPINISMEGIGFAIFQVNIFYNTKSTQDMEPTTDKDAFILNADLTYNDSNHIMLSVCTRLKDNHEIAHTGMAILEVGMLSGVSLFSGAAVQADFVRRVDIGPERVSLYLTSVTKSDICVTLPLVRTFKVAHVKDAVLQVYDYYEPTRKTTRTYNTDGLHTTDACSFCGENCDNCRPGITIAVTSHHSRSAMSFSLAL